MIFFVGPELKVVATMSSGTDNINTFECQRRGIDVCKTPDIAADAAADIAVALILMTSRKIVQGRSNFLLRKRLLMLICLFVTSFLPKNGEKERSMRYWRKLSH